MKRLFRRGLHVICLIISGCVLCNCTRDAFENEHPDFKDDSYITLTVTTPGMDVPETRAIAEADENYLAEVDVLVFRMVGDKEIFHYMTHGTNLGAIAPQRTFKVKLRVSDMVDGVAESHRFVVVANLRDELNAAATAGTLVEGKTKEEVLAAIQFSATGKWNTTSSGDFTPLPMWGESAKMHPVNDKLQSSTIGTIDLVRAIARIDVGLNFESDAPDALPQGLPDFKISDVYVYNTMSKGVVAPLSANFDLATKTAIKPTIPIGAVRAANPIIYTHTPADNGMVREIYIAESSNNDSDLANDEITCLVVGGHYKASATKTYYRIDFYEKQAQDENGPQVELDILRNHRYKVNITAVTGPGYEDPDDAVNSVPVNMKSEILTWDEGEMDDITFDGHYYFGITARDIVFSPVAPASEVIKIKSNVPDLALWLGSSIKLQAGTGGAKTYTNNSLGFKYELEDMGSNKYTLTITSSEHNISMTPTDRKEEFTFHAKRLRVPFTTKQTGTEVYISLENDGTSAFLPEGTQLTDSLPLRILSSQPVTVTVDDGETTKSARSWVTDYKDASLKDGLYQANFKFNIGLYTGAYGSSTALRREATVTIEPATTKKFTVTYNITQQRPYILFSENLITWQRTPKTTDTQKVTIQTNLPVGALKISKGTVVGGDKFILSEIVYGNDATRPRVGQVDVTADRRTAPDDGNIVATNFTASGNNNPKMDFEVDALLTARFQPITLRFNWSWNFGVEDQGMDYIFPWNTDSDAGKSIPDYIPAQIKVNTNDTGIDWLKTYANANNPKRVTIGELTPVGDGSLSLITFALDTKNWTEAMENPFSVYLKGSSFLDGEAVNIIFKRGVQVFQGRQLGANSIAYTGVEQAIGATSMGSEITANVEWEAESMADWLTVKYGVGGTWGAELNHDSKFYSPALSAAELRKTHMIYYSAEPWLEFNPQNPVREGRVKLINLSRSIEPDKSGAPDIEDAVIYQYARVLTYNGSCIPSGEIWGWDAVTYDLACRTNMSDYTLQAFVGKDNTGLELELTSITKTLVQTNLGPQDASISFTLPALPESLPEREITFYLVDPSYPESYSKVKTVTQKRGINMSQAIPNIVAMDESGRLNLEGKGKVLFFKLASLIGLTQVNMCADMTHRILFNPLINQPVYKDIEDIPYSFQTLLDFRKGTGDICRYIGLTAEEMRNMSDSELNAYNSGFRTMSVNDFTRITKYDFWNDVILNKDYSWTPGNVATNALPMGVLGYEGQKYLFPSYGYFEIDKVLAGESDCMLWCRDMHLYSPVLPNFARFGSEPGGYPAVTYRGNSTAMPIRCIREK